MSNPPRQSCRCCGNDTEVFGHARVLGKYRAAYHRCKTCGFIQTETPFWLSESYANPMTSYDLGGISRPTQNSQVVRSVLTACFDPAGRGLDFGGGYGVLTRWMRDLGYDFWHYDKHCQNLFANGFDADTSGAAHYELATAFEVFEHLAEPIPAIESIFQLSDSILFTTDLIPDPPPRLDEWWYFGPEHGQHVAFYTPEALRRLAAQFGARYFEGCNGFHLLSRRNLSETRFRLATRSRVLRAINFLFRRRSLLPSDFQAAMARAKEAARPFEGA